MYVGGDCKDPYPLRLAILSALSIWVAAGCAGQASIGSSGGGSGGGGVESSGGSCSAGSVSFSGIDSISNVSGSSATLHWTDAVGAYEYFIFDVTSGTPQLIKAVKAPATQSVVTGLSQSTTYSFRVRAVDSQGLMDSNSNDVAATTTAQTEPNDISNLILWLKSDAGVEEEAGDGAEDADAVERWLDQSGQGNHAVQSNLTNRPILADGAVNGLPVIRFDGSNDYLPLSTEVTTARTLFVVVKFDGAQGNYTPIWGHSGVVNQYLYGGRYMETTYTQAGYVGGTWRESGVAITATTTNIKTTWQILAIETSQNVRFDQITSDRNIVGRFLDGDIAEMIVYDRALNSGERDDLESYLSQRYGIALP